MSSISVGNLSSTTSEMNRQIRQSYAQGSENVEQMGNAVKAVQNSSKPGTANFNFTGKGMNIDIYG